MHTPKACTPESNQLLDFDYGRLERQLGTFLGPQPSQEDLHHLTFSFTNVMAWLARGEPLSLEYLIWSTLIALSFGIHNTAENDGHPMAQRTPPSPANDEFMGVIEHVVESFHNLLVKELESPSGSDSSRGSHHPSRKCFMTGTPRDMSKASPSRRLPRRTTSATRLKGRQRPHLAWGWSS